MQNFSPNYFSDYDAYTENEIVEITQQGISLKSGRFIDFDECTANFQHWNPEIDKCVGEREAADCSFTFYTSNRAIMIKFVKQTRDTSFRDLQSKIIKLGYQTYDIL